jgi:hypothetical protein
LVLHRAELLAGDLKTNPVLSKNFIAMQNLSSYISNFEPIALKDMDSVQLMNRTDTKFIFNSARLAELLKQASNYYKILQIEEERDFPYCTVYMDTKDFHFFGQHMCGRPNRYKIRYRTYESTGQTYLEVKCKTNKKRTVKWRIKNKFHDNTIDERALEFLSEHIKSKAHDIEPVLVNRFHRITLVGIETKERITIDYNLSFETDGKHYELPYLSIAELKREGFTNNSPFLSVLRDMGIRQTSFSKYCVGNALLRALPKTNKLKISLLQLKKIKNDESSYSFN